MKDDAKFSELANRVDTLEKSVRWLVRMTIFNTMMAILAFTFGGTPYFVKIYIYLFE